ncbi:unnamed protein product [Meganyctiphanes norvegica]|uniref:CUB domain-containing protein n=1 Tax=Meganyctiphanes norvegica TaxID=48144 RepID=A0AAV2RI72_MEGNR
MGFLSHHRIQVRTSVGRGMIMVGAIVVVVIMMLETATGHFINGNATLSTRGKRTLSTRGKRTLSTSHPQANFGALKALPSTNDPVVPWHPNHRRERSIFNSFFLSPLTVVRIKNDPCESADGMMGTCDSKLACVKAGGKAHGICAQGFGVCCIVMISEGGVSSANNTVIQKTSFDEGLDISYTIMKMNENICQFRLWVQDLDLFEVSSNGICDYDYMKINQDVHKFDKICGLSLNLHYYIDVDDDYAIFSFHTDAKISYERFWTIYVQQISCNMAAPYGCGQWYWGLEGTITIWSNVDPEDNHWYYIDNQEYAICIRWEAGYCEIEYSEELRFQPRCDDVFERPAKSQLQDTCSSTPPADTDVSYTFQDGVQYFYLNFKDNTNEHIGAQSNPFTNPVIKFTQKICT